MASLPDRKLAPDRMKGWPNLTVQNHGVTSDEDTKYNCIAWACGTNTRLMWPDIEDMWWPDDVPVTGNELEDLVALFKHDGYKECADGNPVSGYEKVALYAYPGFGPTHAARQLPDGNWTSKLGMKYEDIAPDSLEAVGGGGAEKYGEVVKYLERPNPHMGVPSAAP